MSSWVNGSLEELLGLAPSEPRIALSAPSPREDGARRASIDAALEALSERDRGWRAWRGDRVSRE